MACGEFKQPPLRTPEFTEPGVAASDHLSNLGEREAVSDQALRQRALGTLLEPQRLGVGAERLRNGMRAHEPALLLAEPFEAGAIDVLELLPRWHGHEPTVTMLCHLPLGVLPDLGRLGVEERYAVGDRTAVEVEELGDALRYSIGRARDHNPRVAVPEEHDIAKVLKLDKINEVCYVSIQVHLRVGQVG